eukprot:4630452-Ditylum_brightwellii.AAC.1
MLGGVFGEGHVNDDAQYGVNMILLVQCDEGWETGGPFFFVVLTCHKVMYGFTLPTTWTLNRRTWATDCILD